MSSIGEQTGLAMAEALKCNSTLHTFLMDAHNDIGEQTGVAMAEALKHNSKLHTFHMDASHWNMDASDTGFGEQTAVAKSIQVHSQQQQQLIDLRSTAAGLMDQNCASLWLPSQSKKMWGGDSESARSKFHSSELHHQHV